MYNHQKLLDVLQLEVAMQLEVADMSTPGVEPRERHVGCEREALTGLPSRADKEHTSSSVTGDIRGQVVHRQATITRLVDQPKTKQPPAMTRPNVQGPKWSRPNGRGTKWCERQLGSHARATLSAQWLGAKRSGLAFRR